MPKMKSNRGAAKRFRATGSGKIVKKKSGLRHILTSKATGRKRKLRKAGLVAEVDAPAVRRMLPYL
ncbi:LSU ribosomal protein L35p [hydrothermal vent metagenome]|uniref:LSU ribosomal protein L35p n=1 Tax=hydrothermal vent metagenome TaxID=652676 RepID=A0A3B0RAD6_9ZZZZ